MIQENIKIKRALISVSDKSNLLPLSSKLIELGVEIISTGGTGKFFRDNNINFTPIEKVTGNPEAFEGRMKTISFQILSSLLYKRYSDNDIKQAKELNITPIDLVICNLYPFDKVVEKGGDFNELIENIDIGGPTMIRAAAKNMESVTVCTDVDNYEKLLNILESNNGSVDFNTRKTFALQTFQKMGEYDSMIASTLEKEINGESDTIHISGVNKIPLRYGENPHQSAKAISTTSGDTLLNTTPIQGKQISYNNYLDADAAIRCTKDLCDLSNQNFSYCVTIIKHSNPCGAAVSNSALNALQLAWSGDPISSFGSIIAFSSKVDESIAEWLSNKFVEIIIAPKFTEDALKIFSKKKNLRLIEMPIHYNKSAPMIRSITGGFLVQNEDTQADSDFNQVTNKQFDTNKVELAKFGTTVVKHLKSNAIVLVQEMNDGLQIIGAGMGNPNRLISLDQSVKKAKENGIKDLSSSILVSDAFFPFRDNINLANNHNIKYIIQPGGSIKDNEVIEACNDFNIAMVFTGTRHFRH